MERNRTNELNSKGGKRYEKRKEIGEPKFIRNMRKIENLDGIGKDGEQ